MHLIKYISCFVILALSYGKAIFREDYTYSTNRNNYYKLHGEKATWQDAVAICRTEGAQLFYPVDEAEASEVDTLLSPWSGRNFIWIGVSDLRVDTFYETVDGRPLSEVHHRWDVNWGEPDRAHNHHCVKMWTKYELWLKPCSDEIAFICKYDPESSQDDGIENTTSQAEITESSTSQAEITESSTSQAEITESATSQAEITESSTVVIETTTLLSIDSGDDVTALPTEAVKDQPRSHVHFGDLIGEELERFTPKRKLQIMVSILQVIRDYEAKAPTQCEQVVESEQLEPGDISQ